MNRKGVFGFVITLVLIVMLVWIWALLTPNITPLITSTLNETSTATHSDGVEFFLRMIPWAVPFIFVIGMLWTGASR